MSEAEDFQRWVGRTRSSDAAIDPTVCERLAATFGIEWNRDSLPPCWHWLYHLDAAQRADIRLDGHATAGDFLPPIQAKRRMFAGSRLRFHQPVRLGVKTHSRQTISRIEKKSGRQGDIWLITIETEILKGDQLLVEEQKSIVLLQTSGGPRTGRQSDMKAEWTDTETPDEVLLFRFSALTFNSHRIHYDREYVTSVEGYPERVVHGPLQAMLLALKAEEWAGKPLEYFNFRGVAPAFLGDRLTLNGRRGDNDSLQLEIHAQDGIVTTTAEAGIGGN